MVHKWHKRRECLRGLVAAIADESDEETEFEVRGFIERSVRIMNELKGLKLIKKKKELNKQLHDRFLCPISKQIMQDPVIISSGETFDRVVIEKYISDGGTVCPVTNATLELAPQLIPNILMKQVILKSNPAPIESAVAKPYPDLISEDPLPAALEAEDPPRRSVKKIVALFEK